MACCLVERTQQVRTALPLDIQASEAKLKIINQHYIYAWHDTWDDGAKQELTAELATNQQDVQETLWHSRENAIWGISTAQACKKPVLTIHNEPHLSKANSDMECTGP